MRERLTTEAPKTHYRGTEETQRSTERVIVTLSPSHPLTPSPPHPVTAAYTGAVSSAQRRQLKRAAWAKEDMATVLKAIAQETEIAGTKARIETEGGGPAINIILDR